MGPHPAIMHVPADDRERLAQRELVRQGWLKAEVLAHSTRATTWLQQVAPAVADLAATPGWATLRRSRLVGLLVGLLIIGVSVLGPESQRAAAWESGVGSRGSTRPAASAECTVETGPFILLTDANASQPPPAAPWCAAHC